MPIFSPVESKSTAGRLFHTAVFVLLTLGAVAMLYPLLLLVSGSFRSEVDENELGLIPGYFIHEDALYQKFLEYKYEQRIGELNAAHLSHAYSFAQVEPPASNAAAARDLRVFLEESDLPLHWQGLAGSSGLMTIPKNLRTLRQRVQARFDGDVEAFARETGTAITSWTQVTLPTPEWLSKRYDFTDNALNQEYAKLLRESPPAERRLVSLSGTFLTQVVYPEFGTLEKTNAALDLDLKSFHDFRFPRRVPPARQAGFRKAWLAFVTQDLNPSFVLLGTNETTRYREFLSGRYGGDIAKLNAQGSGANYGDFSEIMLPQGEYLSGARRLDYGDFLTTVAPEQWTLTGPEYAWADWLRQKYHSPEALSEAYDQTYADFEYVWLPQAELESQYMHEHAGALRWQFATQNFVNVIDAIAVEGRVLWNTALFCSLSVLLAVLINPLAAYALSRFQMPGSYKLLLLMMAVMAFPPMVTTIPVFLMLQKLGLMNTFAGLLLPTIANGYLIFLLKGFFDSLPRELYEAAQLEGASEARMFFTITMALSKPILAVVALSAFNAAYTLFLFAIIVAPEQDMWLLPVWLYQYRETVSSGGVYASVLLAAIPPLLVFIFAQKVILRGIVVPTEK